MSETELRVLESKIRTLEVEQLRMRDSVHDIREIAQVAREVATGLKDEKLDGRMIALEQYTKDFAKMFKEFKNDQKSSIKELSKQNRNLMIGFGSIIGAMEFIFNFII